MKGRNPYPISVIKENNKQARFTKEEIAHREENEPQIESCVLACPEHISKDAKKEWKRIVKLYEEIKTKIVTDLDVNALEIYCEALVTYRKAMIKVRESSEVYKTDAGARINPWLKVANDSAIMIKKYGEMLLLDPISRARIGIAKEKEVDEDPMAGFLRAVK